VAAVVSRARVVVERYDESVPPQPPDPPSEPRTISIEDEE
jgi:hypothetical protein